MMTDNGDKNKRGFEDSKASDDTKSFAPIGDADGNDMDSDETKAFVIDDADGASEPSEERASIREYTVAGVAWRILRPLMILAISAAVVILIGVTIYHYVEGNYFAPVGAESAETKEVEIKTGSSLSTIASQLYEEGIVRNKLVFQLYVDFNDLSSSLVAGTYDLSPGMTMEEIVDIIVQGDGGREILTVTFTEGMTIEDMANTLVNKEIFNNSEREVFLSLCNDIDTFSDDYEFIEALKETEDLSGRRYAFEGYLFPDTYEIYADAEPKDIIIKLLNRFDNVFKINDEQHADEIGMTVDEIMTLASMIEWEGLTGDFKKVSAVFYNRLDIEQKLESCATMRYVTGENKLSYTEDLAIDDPYNTYKYSGLPLGPVCNPGAKAIDAALYPDEAYREEGFLFFCNKADDSGALVFAKDYDEHKKNVDALDDYLESKANGTD